MERRNDEIRETETEASAGVKLGAVRWVLVISTLLLLIAFIVIVAGGMVQVN